MSAQVLHWVFPLLQAVEYRDSDAAVKKLTEIVLAAGLEKTRTSIPTPLNTAIAYVFTEVCWFCPGLL